MHSLVPCSASRGRSGPPDRRPDVGRHRRAVSRDEHPRPERDHGGIDRDHADPDREPARRPARQVVRDGVRRRACSCPSAPRSSRPAERPLPPLAALRRPPCSRLPTRRRTSAPTAVAASRARLCSAVDRLAVRLVRRRIVDRVAPRSATAAASAPAATRACAGLRRAARRCTSSCWRTRSRLPARARPRRQTLVLANRSREALDSRHGLVQRAGTEDHRDRVDLPLDIEVPQDRRDARLGRRRASGGRCRPDDASPPHGPQARPSALPAARASARTRERRLRRVELQQRLLLGSRQSLRLRAESGNRVRLTDPWRGTRDQRAYENCRRQRRKPCGSTSHGGRTVAQSRPPIHRKSDICSTFDGSSVAVILQRCYGTRLVTGNRHRAGLTTVEPTV